MKVILFGLVLVVVVLEATARHLSDAKPAPSGTSQTPVQKERWIMRGMKGLKKIAQALWDIDSNEPQEQTLEDVFMDAYLEKAMQHLEDETFKNSEDED